MKKLITFLLTQMIEMLIGILLRMPFVEDNNQAYCYEKILKTFQQPIEVLKFQRQMN